jgi:hypothetical protein
MHEDARFIIWGDNSGGCTIDSNNGKGYEINEARTKADAQISGLGYAGKVYLLRMEHVYIPPTKGGWKKVG